MSVLDRDVRWAAEVLERQTGVPLVRSYDRHRDACRRSIAAEESSTDWCVWLVGSACVSFVFGLFAPTLAVSVLGGLAVSIPLGEFLAARRDARVWNRIAERDFERFMADYSLACAKLTEQR